MSDIFSNVFSSEGFSEAYSRKLRPQSREERVAEYAANKSSFAAAKEATMHTFLTGDQLEPAPGALSPDANLPTREEYRDLFASLTREQRAAASDALLDIELNNGELSDTAAAESDEYEYEYEADDDGVWRFE